MQSIAPLWYNDYSVFAWMGVFSETGASVWPGLLGDPARLELDGTGQKVTVGTLFDGWNGTYPHPAYSTGISATPVDATPATAQQLVGTSATTRGNVLMLLAIDGALYCNAPQTTNGVTFRRSVGGVFADGVEARAATVHAGSTAAPNIYINGSNVNNTSGSVTDVGGATPGATVWLGDAGFTFTPFEGGIRCYWWIDVELSGAQIASLDALIAAEDHTGAAAFLLGLSANAVYLPFLTSDNGADGGSIYDLNGNQNGTPSGTVAADLVPV